MNVEKPSATFHKGTASGTNGIWPSSHEVRATALTGWTFCRGAGGDNTASRPDSFFESSGQNSSTG